MKCNVGVNVLIRNNDILTYASLITVLSYDCIG